MTVAEVARSVEFRYREGGPMQVISVYGTVRDMGSRPIFRGTFGGSNDQIVDLASRVLQEVAVLTALSTPEDELMYLFPIKRNAGLAYVMATAHGDLAKTTISQLIALSDQISFADTYLNKLMEIDAAFASVVELISVRERIRSLLN